MSFHSRRRFAHEEAEPIAPSELWLVAQTIALVIFSSWALGTALEWTQAMAGWITLAGLAATWLRYRETREFTVMPFAPVVAWTAWVGIALSNPSHAPLPNGGWLQRPEWISWLPTTADLEHTLVDARIGLAALLQGGLMIAVARSTTAVHFLWSAIALNGCALAITGAFFHFGGAEQMLGVIDTPEPSYFFATFFYKNHWAAYGALTATVALALALETWPAALAGNVAARGRMLLFGVAGLLTIVTLPLPGSRAGVFMALVLLGGFAALLLLGWWKMRGRRAVRAWAIGFGGVLAAGIVAFGAQGYQPRGSLDLQRTRRQLGRVDGQSLDLRLRVSQDTWKMARARPWFGWGAGCFEIVWPVFQGNYLRDDSGRPRARFETAHNDWLQLLAENGFVGAVLLLAPVGWLFARNWRRAALAGRWVLGGCAMLAAYAWLDFPFHNPAVLLLWAIVLTTAHRLRPGRFKIDAPGQALASR